MTMREFFGLFRRVPEPGPSMLDRSDIVKALVKMARRAQKQDGLFDVETLWCLGILCKAVDVSVQEISLGITIEEKDKEVA